MLCMLYLHGPLRRGHGAKKRKTQGGNIMTMSSQQNNLEKSDRETPEEEKRRQPERRCGHDRRESTDRRVRPDRRREPHQLSETTSPSREENSQTSRDRRSGIDRGGSCQARGLDLSAVSSDELCFLLKKWND